MNKIKMESKTTHTMFPTLGRLVIPSEDSDELIYCDWCHWKHPSSHTGVTPVQYKEQKWTTVDNVNVTVTAEDKKNTTMSMAPYLDKKMQVIGEEKYSEFWTHLALLMGECYNKDDMIIFRTYIETGNPSLLDSFQDSVEQGSADICPNCIDEAEEQFPDYFDPPDLPPLECPRCHGMATTGGRDYQENITCTCN